MVITELLARYGATGKIDKPALRRAYHVEGLVQVETEH